MSNQLKTNNRSQSWGRRTFGVGAAAALLSVTGLVYADDAVTMAPPVNGADAPATTSDVADNASQDTVFNWKEVPENQNVQITRAVFDQGGYQLYDNVGETIVVPFSNDNLYVMKFAVSHTGQTYFVNEGNAPVLYIPRDGYLENATVPGAKWYPFPKDFHEDHPVYLGIAPSWDAYVNLGWYPDMAWYGGYYCNAPFYAGIDLFPTVGLFFETGGHHYYGWHGYQDYAAYHSDFYHIGYFHRDFYHWASRPYWGGRSFGGGHPFVAGHSFGGSGHSFGGGSFGSHSFNSGHQFAGNGGFGGGHVFHGGNGGSFGGDRPMYAHHSFSNGSGGHSFGGGDSHAFGGGGDSHAFGGGGGGSHFSSGGGGHFGGGGFGGGDHAFGGGGGGHFGGGGGGGHH